MAMLINGIRLFNMYNGILLRLKWMTFFCYLLAGLLKTMFVSIFLTSHAQFNYLLKYKEFIQF